MAHNPNEVRAVRAVRVFLPFYAGMVALLFGPMLARIAGLNVPPLPQLSLALGLVMAISGPGFLVWLAREGQYTSKVGLRFALFPALLSGIYRANAAPPSTPRSPLGQLADDAEAVARDLAAADLDGAKQNLTAALVEAEIVTLAMTRVAPTPEAQKALGAFRDLVYALRGGQAMPAETLLARTSEVLTALRQASAQLRGL